MHGATVKREKRNQEYLDDVKVMAKYHIARKCHSWGDNMDINK
jgi:hypothetical protein